MKTFLHFLQSNGCDEKLNNFLLTYFQTSGGMIKIKFSRGPVCSTPAFERHFEWLLLHYGPVLCVNLLGTRNQEQMLSKAYCDQFQHLSSVSVCEVKQNSLTCPTVHVR